MMVGYVLHVRKDVAHGIEQFDVTEIASNVLGSTGHMGHVLFIFLHR